MPIAYPPATKRPGYSRLAYRLRSLQAAALPVLVAAAHASGQGTWTQLFPSGGPSGAILTKQPVAVGYDAANNRLAVFFQSSPAVASNPPPQVWVLTNANGLGGTPAWTQLS